MPHRRTTPTEQPVRRLRSLEVAADILDVDTRTIRRYIASGRLRAYRVGGKLLKVDLADVEALAVPVQPHEVSA